MSDVMEYLRGRGVTFLVIPHAADETPGQPRPKGFAEDEVVRTVVLRTSRGHALCVVQQQRPFDLGLARAAVGDPGARLADVGEVQHSYPDYEPGAIPPLGLFLSAPMYVDPMVVERDSVVFRAGRHDLSIRITTEALLRDDPVVIAPLTPDRQIEPGRP